MRQKITFAVLVSFVLSSLPGRAETLGGPPLVGGPSNVVPGGAQLPVSSAKSERRGHKERAAGISMVAIGLCFMLAGLYFVHHGNESDARSASYGLPQGWWDGEADRKDGYLALGLGGISAAVGAILWGVGQAEIDRAEQPRGPQVMAGWAWHF